MPQIPFVHIPFAQIDEHIDFLLDRGLNPEIAFSAQDLDRLQSKDLVPLERRLRAAGLRVTIHAPFHDLNPGALDPLVREATSHRFTQTLCASAVLGARLVVFHPGYEKWKYGLRPQLWLDASLDFWPPFLRIAQSQDCLLTVENIFEDRPETLVELCNALDSPHLGHCFDVGHWHLFSGKDLEGWIRKLAPRLFHLHLHDNHGGADEHLPVGEGGIDFKRLFDLLRDNGPAPTMTLEAHSRPHLLRSLDSVRTFLPL